MKIRFTLVKNFYKMKARPPLSNLYPHTRHGL